MGIAGVGILESDLAHDVYNEFLDLYDNGWLVADIRRKIEAWQPELSDDLEREIFQSAYCQALWETGELTASDLAAFRNLVMSDSGLKLWSEEGNDLGPARQRVLLRQLKKISTSKKKPRARKRYRKISKLLFKVGECLLYRHSNGRFYPLLVCDIDQYRGNCHYSMAPVEVNSGNPITVETVAQGQYVGHKIGDNSHPRGFVYGFFVVRPEHRELAKFMDQFVSLGQLSIRTADAQVGAFGGVLSKVDFENEVLHILQDHRKFGTSFLPMKEVVSLKTSGNPE